MILGGTLEMTERGLVMVEAVQRATDLVWIEVPVEPDELRKLEEIALAGNTTKSAVAASVLKHGLAKKASKK